MLLGIGVMFAVLSDVEPVKDPLVHKEIGNYSTVKTQEEGR